MSGDDTDTARNRSLDAGEQAQGTVRPAPPPAGSIYGFPMNGNAYTESLYETVRARGVEVKEGIWAGRWLLAHLHRDDTVHLHWPSFHYHDQTSRVRSMVALVKFVVLSLLLKMRGVRFTWTAHNLYPHDGGSRLGMHRFARRFVVRLASRIFVHGPTAAAIVRKEFRVRPSTLRIIQHGHWIGVYPDEVTRAEARAELRLPSSGQVFLFIGLCKPYKGLEALIGSFSALPPGSTLIIAGRFPSPSYQREVEALAAQVAPGSVRVIPGFVDDQRLQYFLKAADTVVLPYRNVLTSGACLLAMSFGRPVVVPRMGALVDYVSPSCGVLYDPEDPNALVEALRDASTRRFDDEAILRRASEFTWDSAAQALIDEHSGSHDAHRRSYVKTTLAALALTLLVLLARFTLLPLAPLTPLSRAVVAGSWLIVGLGTLAFVSGAVVLLRDARERAHKADLFYHLTTRPPPSWAHGWRRVARRLMGSRLRPGDRVRLRSAEEILATLDDSGTLRRLPFMPEMLPFMGQEMVVHRRIDKINDWMSGNEKRRTRRIVTLVNARCSGTAHDGCQAGCQLLWAEEWLRRCTPGSAPLPLRENPIPGSEHRVTCEEDSELSRLVQRATRRSRDTEHDAAPAYRCQITELPNISTRMSPLDWRQDVRPLIDGNIPLRAWLLALFTALFNRIQSLRGGVCFPVTAPQLASGPTPIATLDLRPGERVKVRDKLEIGRTLVRNHNRGIWFGAELLRFCNQEFLVRSRVERVIHERTGQLIVLAPPCVILEGVCGSGEFLRFCPQNEYVFWREIWLARVDPQEIDDE